MSVWKELMDRLANYHIILLQCSTRDGAGNYVVMTVIILTVLFWIIEVSVVFLCLRLSNCWFKIMLFLVVVIPSKISKLQ